jgi:hypothetical protein
MTIMYPINNSLIQDSNLKNSTGHQFALCESCFWSATIFKLKEQKRIIALDVCPVCLNRNISLIPLTVNEIYELSLGSKGGVEIKFSKSNYANR